MSSDTSPEVPWSAEDLALIAHLRHVIETQDPMPDGLVERAQFALTLEGLHAEVAEVRRLDSRVLAVRGEAEPERARTIIFCTDAVTAMVTLSPVGVRNLRIDGWIAPPSTFIVEIRRPDRVVRTKSDVHGRFVVDEFEPGLASIVLKQEGGTGPAVCTPVLEI